jgi:uncharacterized membrane protein YdjX (TVP38/TMEM64 family)
MKGKIAPILITLLLLGLIYFVSRSIDPLALQEWVKQIGIFGPLLIIFLTVITGVVAPLSGTPVNYAGFILYGAETVFLFSISGVISAVINFYIAKKFGRPFLKKFVNEKDLEKVDKYAMEHGAVSLFIMRIFLGSIHDFLSYAMGLTSMKFKPYIVASTSGIIIGSLIWYVIALRARNPIEFLVGTILFALVFSGVYGTYKFAIRVAKTRRTG